MNPPYVSISHENVETAMWRIQMDMARRYELSADRAAQLMGPLHWYVRTGRATPDFLQRMIICKPFKISRRLVQEGSDEEIINQIKKTIGYNDKDD